jgi:phosphoenolpyruvate carboxykinase (GTP)
LAPSIQKYILEKAELCQPDNIVVCDGSDEEQTKLISKLQAEGLIKKIPKLENCWLAKTDPKDVARVESKTVICTESENETIPTPADGVEGKYLS